MKGISRSYRVSGMPPFRLSKGTLTRIGGFMMRTRIVIVYALAGMVSSFLSVSSAFGDSVTITDAEQQVEGSIGYTYQGTSTIVTRDRFPAGFTDADLDVDLSRFGVSVGASLESSFSPSADRVRVTGSARSSAVWGRQPGVPWVPQDEEPDDVHGGARSSFRLLVSNDTSDLNAYLAIKGHISVTVGAYSGLNPDETFVHLSVTPLSSQIPVWETSLSGADLETPLVFDHTVALADYENYVLDVCAESGTRADEDYPDRHSREASFAFTASCGPEVHEIIPLPDLVGEFGSLRMPFRGRIVYSSYPMVPVGGWLKTQIVISNQGWAIGPYIKIPDGQIVEVEVALAPCDAPVSYTHLRAHET